MILIFQGEIHVKESLMMMITKKIYVPITSASSSSSVLVGIIRPSYIRRNEKRLNEYMLIYIDKDI